MAKQSRAPFQKRAKERAHQQKQHDKAQRRLAAKAQRADSALHSEGDYPARAGLCLGPHPLPQPPGRPRVIAWSRGGVVCQSWIRWCVCR
jgi:hypothetical protein